MTAFSVFLQHLKRYRFSTILLFLAIASAETMGTVFQWYFSRIVNTMTALQLPVTASTQQALTYQLLLLFLLMFATWGIWRCSGYLASHVQPRVAADLEQSAFDNLLTKSHRFFLDQFAGGLVRKVRGLSGGFVAVCEHVFWRITPLTASLIVIAIIVGMRSLWISIGIVLGVTFIVALNIAIFYTRRMYELQRAQKDSEATGVLADTISNNLNVKLFATHHQESERFHLALAEKTRLAIFTWRFGEKSYFHINIINVAIEIVVMLYAFHLWQQGVLSLGDFVLIQTYLFSIFSKFFDTAKVIRGIYTGLAEAQEMVDIMNMPEEVQEKAAANDLTVKKGDLTFSHVDFHYQQEKILYDFSLRIHSKEKIALVGPSGAGKSTIMKLLLRLYDIQGGSICIDDQPIEQVSLHSLWRNAALVPQDPILFHRTLRENICYGNPNTSESEMIEATKKAHCHMFIDKLPAKYDTYVGERGVKLSGGERQRIAIARAILSKAPILLLDEATSSLDSESESLIQAALKELMKNKTTIVIAHRLSTIMQMDRIVVIDGGKIVDIGTHDELLAKDGLYRKLWTIQAGGFR